MLGYFLHPVGTFLGTTMEKAKVGAGFSWGHELSRQLGASEEPWLSYSPPSDAEPSSKAVTVTTVL